MQGVQGSQDSTITIAARFCGPPGTGNGGYTAGLLAAVLPHPVEVTLRRPSPLDRPLSLRATDTSAQLLDGETIVAEARCVAVPIPPVSAVSVPEALAASAHYAGHAGHPIPGCFVCGTAREAGDGLRVFAGPLPGDRRIAAAFEPDTEHLDSDGHWTTPLLWSVLDCPTYFALGQPRLPALLGRMTVELHRRPGAGPTVVVAEAVGSEGRKHRSRSSLYDAAGTLLASAEALWIELKSGLPRP